MALPEKIEQRPTIPAVNNSNLSVRIHGKIDKIERYDGQHFSNFGCFYGGYSSYLASPQTGTTERYIHRLTSLRPALRVLPGLKDQKPQGEPSAIKKGSAISG